MPTISHYMNPVVSGRSCSRCIMPRTLPLVHCAIHRGGKEGFLSRTQVRENNGEAERYQSLFYEVVRLCAQEVEIRRSVHVVCCADAVSVQGIHKYEDFSDDQKSLIEKYMLYLLQQNEKFNLTGLKTLEDCIEHFVNDTATLFPFIEKYLKQSDHLSVVDIGSGAGIPGIIIAILRPDWKVVCIEATEKKCNFMKEVITLCNILNVQVVRGRCEEIAHMSEHREKYDVAIARGVAEFRVLTEYCLPFVKVGGLFIAPKGPKIKSEIRDARTSLKLLNGELLEVTEVDSFGNSGQRTALLVRKKSQNQQKYPRKPGIPSKRPL